MKEETFNQELSDFAHSLGATELGFANLKLVPEEKKMGYHYGISVIIKLSDGVLNQIKNEPTQTYFSHYRSVNRLIDSITLRLVLFLEAKGYPSIAIPASQSVTNPSDQYTGAFQHKTTAILSGLGWIGKSALFIHHTYGPRVRMGTILTNAPLTIGVPITTSQCQNCRACVTACPAFAIQGNLWEMGMARSELYDPRACSNHMKKHFQHIGRGEVCGLCITACPIGNYSIIP